MLIAQGWAVRVSKFHATRQGADAMWWVLPHKRERNSFSVQESLRGVKPSFIAYPAVTSDFQPISDRR